MNKFSYVELEREIVDLKKLTVSIQKKCLIQ
jgi:hypothetical protein